MNKKITKIIIGGALTMFLMGCDSLSSKKYENALASLDSKDYESSVTLLEEVLEINPDNVEAKELLEIISNYQKALELSKEDKLEEAKEILENLSEAYDNYSIKEDIATLSSDLKKKINDKEIALVDDMFKKARALFEEGKYTECKEFLDSKVSPKVETIKDLPEDTNIVLASLYLECDESIEEEQLRVAREKEEEEEAKRKAEEEIASSLAVQSYSDTTNNSNNASNNTGNSFSQNNTNTSKPTSTPKPEPTPEPKPEPTPEPKPEPTPVVPDKSSNPFSDGIKNINGFNYYVKDANHWNAELYYKLVCAGMYNPIRFTTPAGELAAVLYYSDDSSFSYERQYETSQSYTGTYFGKYNGRSVHYIIEFSY